MKSPNNGGDRVPTGHLLSPNEASSTGTALHSIELLAKGVSWNSPKTQAVTKTMGCSLQADSIGGTGELLRTTPTQLIENGEVKLVPTWNLHAYILVSVGLEGILQDTEREM